jgi:cytochrome c biogenesis factor
VLAMILGAMIAFDMGGPINKVAFFFGAGLIEHQNYTVMGCVAAAICTPPLGLGLATIVYRKIWSEEERDAGIAALAMGMIGITEGAIPFAASDPLRVIPSMMLGGATTGAIVAASGIELRAPHGGIFVFFAISNFLLFLLATSNPFDRLIPAAPEGRDLNPRLQDPGMVIHPPMLYMGYVGLSVAFSFAVAALIGGNLDATWARWTRPWTTAAWIFLTIGIALGSAWAYYELGWGGWWFWDPVENASFMPWLVATALIHSLAVTEKRNSFKNWTVLLAILAFSLSLLGTFLVRSGVLSSVHAFATDPRRGLFILAFLVLVIGSSLALYAWRAPSVGLGARFGLLSRETLLLGNNVLLVVACGAVLLGTLYPLALDAMNLGKISVGPPYFDTVFVPLLTPLVFLMGVGPMARWKASERSKLLALMCSCSSVPRLAARPMMVATRSRINDTTRATPRWRCRRGRARELRITMLMSRGSSS